jgi:phospholipase C
MSIDRRRFIQSAGAGALASAFPASIARALSIPAHDRTRSLEDVEHIVVLMQENRSFDHFFGTLRGVRGFEDPRAVRLPNGALVWQQPNGAGSVSPFHPDAPALGLAFLEDLAHGWNDTQAALNGGKYDAWVPNKGTTTMAYLTRDDIPYHFALADAFTVCDAYHCSFPGSTDPNRYHMWTGWLGNDGKNGGPVLNNAEAGYDWSTYPERLARNGISWKVYQDVGSGLDGPHNWGWDGDRPYVGNYGDNSLLYFHQYQNSVAGSPLFEGALRGTDVSSGEPFTKQFEADIRAGKLPQVSYIVAPESYTEHPNWPANYGAWYVSQFLDVLTKYPEVFSKTAFFLNYDENDGFFDHVVPPSPATSPATGWSTVDASLEIFAGNTKFVPGALGLGVRVPMIVISPWSRGGWVSSEVFDHTSLIRFIERRFARHTPDLVESNITPWRRAVSGDLTSAFDFESPNDFHLFDHRAISLPSTAAYAPPDRVTHPDYVPAVPTSPKDPRQEPGIRPARPVPYELNAIAKANAADASVKIDFINTGKAAAVFQVRSEGSQDGPWSFTVGADGSGSHTWPVAGADKAYDLSVYGPNGFLRRFKGSFGGHRNANLTVDCIYHEQGPSLTLELKNVGNALSEVRISSAYDRDHLSLSLRPGESTLKHVSLRESYGWYDLTIAVPSDPAFRQQWAGHVETGRPSVTDPAIGARRR